MACKFHPNNDCLVEAGEMKLLESFGCYDISVFQVTLRSTSLDDFKNAK